MNILKGLNQPQKEAICSTQNQLLVVAGAGTGKTKVITHRIANLINSGINQNQILAVTFTNKAAAEMKERIGRLTNIQSLNQDGLTLGTFHSIAADILRKRGDKIDIPSDFFILDEKESLEIVKQSIEELKLNSRQFRPSTIQNQISRQKSLCDSKQNQQIANDDFFPKNLDTILEKYNGHLKERNALDFDDLIHKAVILFEEYPEILKDYQTKWSHIHIDEYQDTDNAQCRLIQLLSSGQNNICAVGDEDQSIYGFRGADFTNILNFEKTWPDAKIVTLERNYRSTQKILDAANAVIAKNKMRRGKNLFTRGKIGTKLTAFEAGNEKEEADFIAKEIENLLQKDKPPYSIAILCRANFQFPVIEEHFLRHSLPYLATYEQDTLTNAKQPIRLMTVHAAKGLEFRHVFIPGLEKGLFPWLSAGNQSSDEEERRLFYVALTRGQEKIFLSWSRFRAAFGFKQINQPSQFLSDIPQNLIRFI